MARTEEEMARDFELRYQGPAFETGRIPVAELGPALIALGDLVREANAVANPMAPPVRLEVQAFRQASFDVTLHIASTDAMTFVKPVLEIIAVFASALTIVQWRRGRRIESVEPIDENTSRIRTADGDEITVAAHVSALIERKRFWKWSRILVRPLKQDGVDSLTIKPEAPDVPPVMITKSDLPAFEAGEEGEIQVHDYEAPILLGVRAAALVPGLAWRLTDDGVRTFPAHITDPDFLERVDRREEIVGAGDTMDAVMRIRQWRDASNVLHTERTIVTVTEYHRGGGTNAQLFNPDDDES